MNDKYRPALTELEMSDIIDALSKASDVRLKRAVKEADADLALAALQHRARVDDLLSRFSRMVAERANAKDTQVPGQMTVDEAFEAKKREAEAEERSDAIVDFYEAAQAARDE